MALSKLEGPTKAIQELERMQNDSVFAQYHLFYSTLAELHIELNEFARASLFIERAISLALLKPEKDLLLKKLAICKEKTDPLQNQ